jgi:hypothetical protein
MALIFFMSVTSSFLLSGNLQGSLLKFYDDSPYVIQASTLTLIFLRV